MSQVSRCFSARLTQTSASTVRRCAAVARWRESAFVSPKYAARKGALMRSVRLWLLFVAVTGLLGLTACGSFFSTCHMCPPVPKSQHFVYTANAGGNQSTVSALSASPSTGQLTALPGSPYNTGSGSIALASDPVTGRLYVVNSQSGNISGFSIDLNSGALTPVASSPFSAESGMNSLAVTPDGNFLYAVSGSSANLWGFSIDSGGALTPTGLLPTLITAAAATSSTASIYGFSRDSATGTVTPLAGFPVAIAGLANKAEFDRAGKFLLVTGTNEFGTKGGIEIFSFDSSSGSLTLVAGPVQVGTDPAGAALDSSGKYAYVPNTADASISAFALDGSSGALTAVAGSPFASGGNGNINGPLGIAASSAGAYLYVCNASNDVSVFSINSGTGSLSAIQGSPFPDGGSGPSAIVFVP